MPPNVTLVPLAPSSPRLTPMERVRLYLRARFLSLRVFQGSGAIVDACCAAWNAVADDSERGHSRCLSPRIAKVTGSARILQGARQSPDAGCDGGDEGLGDAGQLP